MSCDKNNESEINQSIQALTEKFPQLNANKKLTEKEFKLIKSLRDGEFNFEIQLYSQPEGIKDMQQIIVIINSKNEIYSIPFFNNKYKDYWEFPFDKQIPNVSKTNTTFSNQINIAIDKLIDNSDQRKDSKKSLIVHEIFNSVLNCKKIEEKDSIMIYKTMRGNYNIPDENDDSVRIRLRKNYDLMKREWHPENYSPNYNCYFDENNGRIYQINQVGNKINLKTYRMDYGIHMIYL